MVGTKYVLKNDLGEDEFPFSDSSLYTSLGKWGDVEVLRLKRTLPLAVTHDTYIGDHPPELVQGLTPSAHRPEAVSRPVGDDVTVTMHDQADLTVKVNAEGPRLLMISIPFDRGWQASVDGAPRSLAVVDYGFIGLRLDPGESHVRLEFTPRFLWVGSALSALSLALYAYLARRRCSSGSLPAAAHCVTTRR